MIGITACSAYIPRYRMRRKDIYEAVGWLNPATAGLANGERAVANYDEDSITMAVSAAKDCLYSQDTQNIGGLYFSSTTAPYAERLNASVCANALGLPPQIRTADYAASPRSGTTAMVAAFDAVQAGHQPFLVCAADCRQGKPGGHLEHLCGDGAASVMVGRENVIAELKGAYHFSKDFPDYSRLQEGQFVQNWEERWIRDEGIEKITSDALRGFIQTSKMALDDFDTIIFTCPMPAAVNSLCKKIGIPPGTLQDPLTTSVGYTGSAHALLMLAVALEKANPGDKILLVNYGSGCDVIAFEVKDLINKRPINLGATGHLNHKAALRNYNKYLAYRDLVALDIGIRGEETPPVRHSVMVRQGDSLSALVGSKCRTCGTPQYPKQRVCVNPECGTIDQMEDYPFSDKIGSVKSFTGDHLAFSIDPPAIYGLIDFDGGGRLYLDITDGDLETLEVGAAVKMTYRRRYTDKRRGVIAYYWKACPLPNAAK